MISSWQPLSWLGMRHIQHIITYRAAEMCTSVRWLKQSVPIKPFSVRSRYIAGEGFPIVTWDHQTSHLWRDLDSMRVSLHLLSSHKHTQETETRTHIHRPQSCTVALRERLCETTVTHFVCVTAWLRVRARARLCVRLCAGVSVSVCVCYSVLIWLCSQMTVPLYNMTLKCAKCGVISSADVSTTATSNAMLVPLIIFP